MSILVEVESKVRNGGVVVKKECIHMSGQPFNRARKVSLNGMGGKSPRSIINAQRLAQIQNQALQVDRMDCNIHPRTRLTIHLSGDATSAFAFE